MSEQEEKTACSVSEHTRASFLSFSTLRNSLVVVFMLALAVSYFPLSSGVFPMAPRAHAEEPSPGVGGFLDGSDVEEEILQPNIPDQTVKQPTPQAMPFVGDPPPREEDVPTPLSETSLETALAPVTVQGALLGGVVKLRSGPGMAYEVVSELVGGTTVEAMGRSGDWLQVRESPYASVYWVASEQLDISAQAISTLYHVPESTLPPPQQEAVETALEGAAVPTLAATVSEALVNLRRGPGTVYDRIGQVVEGTTVSLLAAHEDWFQVQLDDGSEAWIFGALLSVESSVLPHVPPASSIPELPESAALLASGDVASFALQFVGHPYTYGGSSPGGFDCSGFVRYVFGQHGINLPHFAAAQYNPAVGTPIDDMNQLQPGDVMFFANTAGAGISHVAIYTGDGRMVHAITYGLGVGVSNIWDSYWVNHYYGAIRVHR